MIARSLFLTLAAVAVTACAGSSAPETTQPVNPPAGQGVVVVTSPSSAEVEPGKTVKFGASVTGTADTGVTWTVSEPDGGTIDASGLYTAPSTEGTFHVVATSTTTLKSAGNSVVKVRKSQAQGAVVVAIDPAAATVQAGGTLGFSATVTGSTTGKVDWTVQEGSSCGVVSSSGVYTSPGAAATCHVVATAQSDATKSASATVTVTPPIAVTISPASPSLQAGGSIAFSATVSNTVSGQSSAVAWSVSSGGGTINPTTGVYVAPATAGTYTVTATSVADATKKASVNVVVTALPVAISISPTTAALDACKGQVFTATVSNAANSAVTWTVLEGASGGTVTNGIYTAPQAAGTYHVVATSVADPTKSVQGTITVGAERVLAVAVAPGTATIQANGQVAVSATVTTTCGTFAAQ